ncbi:amino acid permease [Ascoidea rubescens DSM 1968]|uniref:Amino acid permease n=1 Tax=Ascoidea rubescens DSM 1968 TaxID=1344418 RepID=A0A1D2VQV3_9ASCO|nr:amino acid permease [Ascoidea rubescens DSM 1968]ODV63947.1 amino acid permease [Ascoidea rubescens DSM 1968]
MADIEKKSPAVSINDSTKAAATSPYEEKQLTGWESFKDGFRRHPDCTVITPDMTEQERQIAATINSPLQRKLKNRHLQMIAIGGSIGTGLFVGSGSALRTGGPAGVLIGWILVGTMMFSTVHALGELAVTFPITGAFNTYAVRFIDPSWGFAMGFNYALQWFVVFPLELVAASITVDYWESDINGLVWVTLFWIGIVFINFFGVKGYGEAEFVFSMIKVIAIIGYIILGIILCAGGGPRGGYIGGKHWQNPGAFANGFKGVCTVFVTAAFSFAGTELVGLTAAETKKPRESLPKAAKQVFWRITLFYIISLTLVGLLVPYDDERLIGSSSVDAAASPFVISIKNAGISVLPDIFNVVIMIAVLSVGNSSIYGCSRTLAALAVQGLMPKQLGYIDKRGRPLVGIIATSIMGLLAYCSASDKKDDVFNWLLALSGLSSIFTWGTICACHIRFRYALKCRGRDPFEELEFTSVAGVYGSWFGLILNILILIFQFWVALFPLGDDPNPEVFFMSYLAFPVIFSFYFGHKCYSKNWKFYLSIDELDLDSGRREIDIEVVKKEIAEEKASIALRPWWYRTYRFWC